MKGLLIKDFYILKSCLGTLLFYLVIFTVVSISNSNIIISSLFSIYSVIFATNITTSLIWQDEKSKWDIYFNTLPFSRKKAVTEKYLVNIIIIFAVTLVFFTGRFVSLIIWEPALISEFFSTAAIVPLVGIVYSAVALPGVFKFGYQKGQMISVFFMIAIILISFAISFFGIDLSPFLSGIKYALIISASAALPVSLILSVRFYEKREF